jgi:hypothetical protein
MTISLDRLRRIIALILIGAGILVAMWRTDESWKISFRCRCDDLYLVSPEQHSQAEIGKNLLFVLPTGIALFLHPALGLLVSAIALGVLLWIDRTVGYGFPNSAVWYFLRFTALIFMGINVVALLNSLVELAVLRFWRPVAVEPSSTSDTTPPESP